MITGVLFLINQAMTDLAIAPEDRQMLCGGKMLRARFALRLAQTNSQEAVQSTEKAAATIELIHSASLLHDDVLDHGLIRRGRPSYWKKHGISQAIMAGDVLLLRALQLLCGPQELALIPVLLEFLDKLLQGELRQQNTKKAMDLQEYLACVREKTGALFAFLGYAAAGSDEERRAAFTEVGYLAGTAYQLADDYLDAHGIKADKTLHRDRRQNKSTAISITWPDGTGPQEKMQELLTAAGQLLTPWPEAKKSWQKYLEEDFLPAVKFVEK